MFSSQRTATVAAFVGCLAAMCAGVGHAYAEGKPGDCRPSAQGDVVCVHKNNSHVDKDGTHVIKQEQNCTTVDRPHVVSPDTQLLGDQSAQHGPVVECSNTAELPAGFKKPHFEF